MTCRAIISGSVAKPPVEKIGKSGTPFATVTIREDGIEPPRWWSAIVLSPAANEVLRLVVGDPAALAGSVEAEVYTPEGGEPRVSWRFSADSVLSACKRKPNEAAR